MNITKKNISSLISADLSISNEESLKFLDIFLNTIKDKSRNNDVKLSNFGTFYQKKTKKRIGRNPKTMEVFNIPSQKKVSFRPSSKIKEYLN